MEDKLDGSRGGAAEISLKCHQQKWTRMWDTRIIPYFRTALGSHMWDPRAVPNLGIVECPSFKNEL